MGKTFQYKLLKISQEDFWLSPKADFVPPADYECEVTLNLTLSILKDLQQISLRVYVQYFGKKEGEELLRFTADFFFHFLEFDSVFNFKDGRTEIPDGVVVEANSIAVGSVRGMLALLTKGTYLENVYLPIYNNLNLLESFKARVATQDKQPA